MEYQVKSGNPEKQRGPCIAVAIFSPRKLSPAAERIDQVTEGLLSGMLRRGDLSSDTGHTHLLHSPAGMACERVLVVGCGKERGFDEAAYQKVIATAVKTVHGSGAMEMTSYLPELNIKGRDISWKCRLAVEASEAALYRFDRLKSEVPQPKRPLKKIILAVPRRNDLATGETAIKQGMAISLGTALARDLGNLPGNLCTPTDLAKEAKDLAQAYPVNTRVLEESDMEALGMGALLSVSRGSRQPAKFIIMEYLQGTKDEAPVVLVGKGLTFDAGGISLKPAGGMDEMKFDMCGGASVLGTMKALAELGLPMNVVGIIPSSENLPDGEANKPGDVVTSMSGQTIEILNTDAEGRLILCDALTYAERYKPAAVIDVATLTGACVVALGAHASGLLGNHDGLMRELLNAGKYAHDRAWQLPLWEDYQSQLKTNFADMANVGGREAGTITAACFLSRFAKKFKWAHLDIAGTAWKKGSEKGATGRPVSLLTQFLIQRSMQNSHS